MGTGVEPGSAPAQNRDFELAHREVDAVNIGNFELAPGRRLEVFGNVHDLLVVKIDPRHSVRRFGNLRFFLDADGAAQRVEFHDAVVAGIGDVVGKNAASAIHPDVLSGFLESFGQLFTIEDVVAQNERCSVIRNKFLANDECLGKAFRALLHGIVKPHPKALAVAEQVAEQRQVAGS